MISFFSLSILSKQNSVTKTTPKLPCFRVDDGHDASDLFSVTYFDMPMIDYAQVNPDKPIRYSVVLLNIDSDEAAIAVSSMPTADHSADNRYVFDEEVRKIVNPDEPISEDKEQGKLIEIGDGQTVSTEESNNG